jgi:hypothetical protein
MFRSIRWKIAWPYVVLILVTMGALGFLLSKFARLTYLDNLETQLTAEAKMIGEILKPILQLC